MKYVYFGATILLQVLCLRVIKLLDSFAVVVAILALTILVGLSIKLSNSENKLLEIKPSNGENKALKDLGWGLFYGGLTYLALIVAFMMWLEFNFPK
jgi:hypothetical protein